MDMHTIDSPAAAPSDEEVVRRVRGGEVALFELLMRRHNQRLYRAARAVLRDEAEIEDVMQQAYINAFRHLHQFEERSQVSTWLTRITLNEAFARRRRLRHEAPVGRTGEDGAREETMRTARSDGPDPEHEVYAGELRRVLEQAVDELPGAYRMVFVLREVEGLSTGETAQALDLGEEAVKTRLHRARAMLRHALTARLGAEARLAFAFPATRCDRVVAAVLARIAQPS